MLDILQCSLRSLSTENFQQSKLTNANCVSYDVAVMYLEQANYDLEMATEIYADEERWEREHPIHEERTKMKTPLQAGKRRYTGQ